MHNPPFNLFVQMGYYGSSSCESRRDSLIDVVATGGQAVESMLPRLRGVRFRCYRRVVGIDASRQDASVDVRTRVGTRLQHRSAALSYRREARNAIVLGGQVHTH